jgi:hypothetical protein
VVANVRGEYAVPTVPAANGEAVEIERAAVGAATVIAMEGALCSPWVEPESFEFPNQAAA